MRQKGPKMGMEGKREDNDEKLARKLQWEESRRAVEATEEQIRVLREVRRLPVSLFCHSPPPGTVTQS